jgi:hypothetical protein
MLQYRPGSGKVNLRCARRHGWASVDGGQAGDLRLYDFLREQNQKASHFMIGVNIIRDNPQ